MANEAKAAHGRRVSGGGAERRRQLRARLRMSYFGNETAKATVESIEVRRRILMICKQSYWNQFGARAGGASTRR